MKVNDFYPFMNEFVPFIGFVAGLIGACVFRRLSRTMLLVIAGFACLCVEFTVRFLSFFLAFGMGRSNVGGLGVLVFVSIVQIIGWGSLIAGLVLTWKNFAKRAGPNER